MEQRISVTFVEALNITGWGRTTLRNEINAGTIEHYHRGTRIYIDYGSLLSYIEDLKVAARVTSRARGPDGRLLGKAEEQAPRKRGRPRGSVKRASGAPLLSVGLGQPP